jgi:hypothetical protein
MSGAVHVGIAAQDREFGQGVLRFENERAAEQQNSQRKAYGTSFIRPTSVPRARRRKDEVLVWATSEAAGREHMLKIPVRTMTECVCNVAADWQKVAVDLRSGRQRNQPSSVTRILVWGGTRLKKV